MSATTTQIQPENAMAFVYRMPATTNATINIVLLPEMNELIKMNAAPVGVNVRQP